MMAHKAGQSVSADMHDSPTEDAIVTPNCVKNVPDVPGMNVTGMNTAINTNVQETTATDTSFMACRVASRASLMPFSIFVITASTTTMASSTTVPIASTRAKSVMLEAGEMIYALPKALNDYRFAWTDENKTVLVRGNK